MPKHTLLTGPARISVGALLLLGFLGGSLIVAYSGYETSPRRGGTSVFVPTPEAYVIAACMYAMSCLAMLALLRSRTTRTAVAVAALGVYVVTAYAFILAIGPLR